jgi:hypothetical protein
VAVYAVTDLGLGSSALSSAADLTVIANLLNSALTSIARWYRPAGRLKPAQIAGQLMNLLQGLLISAPSPSNGPDTRASA